MPEILEYSDFVLSTRGLASRPILPVGRGFTAFKSDLASVFHEIYDKTVANQLVSSGALDLNLVMFDTLQPWRKDSIGYTFQWTPPNTVFADPHKYRIKITFVVKNPHPTYPLLQGKGFILTWQNTAKDPLE